MMEFLTKYILFQQSFQILNIFIIFVIIYILYYIIYAWCILNNNFLTVIFCESIIIYPQRIHTFALQYFCIEKMGKHGNNLFFFGFSLFHNNNISVFSKTFLFSYIFNNALWYVFETLKASKYD